MGSIHVLICHFPATKAQKHEVTLNRYTQQALWHDLLFSNK